MTHEQARKLAQTIEEQIEEAEDEVLNYGGALLMCVEITVEQAREIVVLLRNAAT